VPVPPLAVDRKISEATDEPIDMLALLTPPVDGSGVKSTAP
jgi:hypothetical protein